MHIPAVSLVLSATWLASADTHIEQLTQQLQELQLTYKSQHGDCRQSDVGRLRACVSIASVWQHVQPGLQTRFAKLISSKLWMLGDQARMLQLRPVQRRHICCKQDIDCAEPHALGAKVVTRPDRVYCCWCGTSALYLHSAWSCHLSSAWDAQARAESVLSCNAAQGIALQCQHRPRAQQHCHQQDECCHKSNC